jgi:hypothetical protein
VNRIINFIDKVVVPYVFTTNDEPLLFRELLKANKMYDDGLKLEGKIPGTRIRIGRNILVFLLLWNIILLPISGLFHKELEKVDCHLLIISAIIFTGLFFATYSMFKAWMIDRVALKVIKEAWANHYPHFSYEKHHKQVSRLYGKALDKELPTKDIQLYILDHMLEEE